MIEEDHPTCQFVKPNRVYCKRKIAEGERFCWQHAHGFKARWRSLTRNQSVLFVLTVLGVVAAVVGLPIFHHEREHILAVAQQAARTEPPITLESTANPEPRQTEPPNPKKPPNRQKATYVKGNGNVTGKGNQAAPIAIAPNGIAITGGNVTNPTVNNFTTLPDLTISDLQEKQVTDSLDQIFTGVDVSIMEVQSSQDTRDFSERLARILKASGANVELSSAFMYALPPGMTPHKGMAITSFPPERKSIVEKFVNALGTARVIQVVPIYEREDKKINIIVNRSRDTPEEGKQY